MECKIILRYLFLVCFSVSAQKNLFYEKGFLVGFGHGLSIYNLPEGNYRPFFFMGHFGIDLLKKNKQNLPFGKFTLYFEPQFNPVLVENYSKNLVEQKFEFGLNIGFKQTVRIYKNLFAFIHGGVGPHFHNSVTRKQFKGFLFSDNFGLGLSYKISENKLINLGFRLRHLSNANLEMPNSGINTYNYHFGMSWIIP
ncbi:MAG: acyloxyacyl hydrolase [Cytophagales bacterium]|nr:MAG: acyloxyacyl hydrolase [Cytophagales bacterium]